MIWDKAFLINLDECTLRLKLTTAELNKWNIPFVRFPAIKHEVGKEGCRAAHIAIYKLAIAEKITPLIIEDDIIIQKDFDRLHKTIAAVERHSNRNWDIIFFYRDTRHQTVIENEDLILWGPTVSTHFYMVNNKSLPKVMQAVGNQKHPMDWNIVYSARACQLKCYCAATNLVCQDSMLHSTIAVTGHRSAGPGLGGLFQRGYRKYAN